MTSFPGQRDRSEAMSSQLTVGLNSEPVRAIVIEPLPAKLAKSIASLRSIRSQYPGRAAMLASVRLVSAGGMISPFRWSLVRCPVTRVSTVTTSTR